MEAAYTRIELIREYLSLGHNDKAAEIMKGLLPSFNAFGEYLIPDNLKYLYKELIDEKSLLKEIMKLGQDLVTIRDNKELVRLIVSTANRITGAERGAIFLLEKNKGSVNPILRAARNMAIEDISHPSFDDSMRMIKETVATEEGRVQTNNSTVTPHTRQDSHVRDRICVPMKIRNEVVGVLYHDNRIFRSTFKETDLEILSYFASQAAIAMDNARAYEEIQALNETLSLENKYYEEQQIENFHFDEIIGKSPVIKEVLSKVMQVADTDSSILLLGETGVGKELVARAIHQNSSRKKKPFIRVNCSAFPETLIASELFGHEKGAFTGATERRIGRFELANKSTIFLDEIGGISPEVQMRLLRVIQFKEFDRLGGRETIPSDFRLVAATNRNLYEAVKAKTFREDLYYRLNVFPIYIPPLRDRKEDIPLLAYYFLKKITTRFRKTITKISELEMTRLMNYDWPGNVRELENVIERGVILSAGPRFKMPELRPGYIEPDTQNKIRTYREMEVKHIHWVLKASGGKIRGNGGAAEILDMNPNTLYSKMKKLGIQKPKPEQISSGSKKYPA